MKKKRGTRTLLRNRSLKRIPASYIPFTWRGFFLLHIWSLSHQHQNRSCNAFSIASINLFPFDSFFERRAKRSTPTFTSSTLPCPMMTTNKQQQQEIRKTWPNTMEYDYRWLDFFCALWSAIYHLHDKSTLLLLLLPFDFILSPHPHRESIL